MTLAAVYASIVQGFSEAMGGPFVAAVIHSPGVPVIDVGGSIVTPGTPVERACLAQVDVATEAMRGSDGYADGDVRILVLADGLSGTITTDERIEIEDGPSAGLWSIEAVSRDPAGIGFELRGRRSG